VQVSDVDFDKTGTLVGAVAGTSKALVAQTIDGQVVRELTWYDYMHDVAHKQEQCQARQIETNRCSVEQPRTAHILKWFLLVVVCMGMRLVAQTAHMAAV
jgi:hypothetical protein